MEHTGISNLLSNGGYGCVYYPSISCKGKQNISKKEVTKIQKNDESATNEQHISDIVRKIKHYKNHFVPITKSCGINVSKLSSNLKTNCDIFQKKGNTYILMYMPYINGSTLNEHLRKSGKSKDVMNNLLTSYEYLLSSIQLLIDNNIVHYDLKGNNIMYHLDKNIPLIIDFGMSIDLEDIHKYIEFYFFTYAPSYYYWCPEIHFINYIIHSKKYTPLTKQDINKVSLEILKQNDPITNNMSQEFNDKYYTYMKEYYYRFAGMDGKDVIRELLNSTHTWDNYSLSIIYLKLLTSIYPDGYDENDFISRFSQILLFNLHPDPNKRYSISKTREKLKAILLNTNMKTFIDVLDSLKLHREKFNRSLINTEKQSIKMGDELQSKRE